jgi:hypothetical protein
MSTTVTRLFDDYSDAEAAVRELERLGVPHDHVSIVANHPDHAAHSRQGDADDVNHAGDVSRGVTTGAALGGVGGLLAGVGLLAIPGLGPLVAAGWLATTLAGAGLGAAGGAATGTIVGALTAAGVSEDESHVYAEGVRRGGTLVSARVPEDMAERAEAVLNGNRAVDIASRGQTYRQEGWSGYDDQAPAYTREQIAQERSRHSTGALL